MVAWSDWRSRVTPTKKTTTTTKKNTNAGYSAATSAGRSTISSGVSRTPGINQTARDEYWGTPNIPGIGRTTAEYQGYRTDRGYTPYMNTSATPTFSGSSSGGSYGGGGGGSSMTQAMFDAMLAAIGTSGSGLTLQQVDLPDFQGQSLAAFDPSAYTQALGSIDTAVTADQAASQAAAAQADAALRANYTNAYGNAQVTQGPQAQQVGNALQATAGGGGQQAQVAAQSNQAAGSDQASFQNLLNVLAAADTQAQGSRLNQVALDQASAGRNINAQALGLRGGVNTKQAQAQSAWQQAAAERDYQNALMQQQWEREEMTRNQDIANQQAQGNWQQRNEMISNRLAPLLQLLQSSGSGINTAALQQMLAGWQQ